MNALACVVAAALGAGPLEAGVAAADVTPDVANSPRPVWIAGFGHGRRATGVAEPLAARAVVLRHGGRKVALVCVDAIGLFHREAEAVRKLLPGFDYVLVSSTHTHEGPDTLGLWGPTPFQSGVDRDYVARVVARAADAVKAADAAAKPVTAHLGTARAPELLRDSRQPIVLNEELTTLLFRDAATGSPAGLVVAWGNHPETYPEKSPLVSSDFVHHAVEALKKGHGCPVAYFTGSVGGLMTTIGVPVPGPGGKPVVESGAEKVALYGRALAAAASKAVGIAKPVRLTPFAVRSRPLVLPVANPVYQLGAQLGVLDRTIYRWTGDTAKAEPLASKVVVGQPAAVRTELAWLRLGELSVAAVPGEIYPELVVDRPPPPADPAADFPGAPFEPTVYGSLPGPHKLVIGLANDEVGYVIPKRQWDEKPPFAYGRTKAPYGEVNSLGPETAPLMLAALRELVRAAE